MSGAGTSPAPRPLAKVAPQPVVAARRSKGDFLRGVAGGALLGEVAITLGWVITEAAGTAHATTIFGVAVYVATLGAVLGLINAAWGDLSSRVYSRAIVRAAAGAWIGLIGGAAAGSIAFLLYDNFQSSNADPSGWHFYLLRVLAWAIFGAGIGAAPGIAERASPKIRNGVLGGIIGGALGGLALHWASFEVASERDARLLGLTAIGIGIGACTAGVEVVRRKAWLRVIAGGMTGKEHVIHHQETYIGNSTRAHFMLIKDPEVAPVHAVIRDDRGARTLHALGGRIQINGSEVARQRLCSGDRIQIGGTTLSYEEARRGEQQGT
jgi:hypothetical protein